MAKMGHSVSWHEYKEVVGKCYLDMSIHDRRVLTASINTNHIRFETLKDSWILGAP